MNGLIRASLRNPIAVTVMTLTLAILGGLATYAIPVDILPVFRSPAVQVLTFYGGMPAASIEKNITSRMERGVVQASGGERVESRSIVGASIVRDYFGGHVDPSGAVDRAGPERRSNVPQHLLGQGRIVDRAGDEQRADELLSATTLAHASVDSERPACAARMRKASVILAGADAPIRGKASAPTGDRRRVLLGELDRQRRTDPWPGGASAFTESARPDLPPPRSVLALPVDTSLPLISQVPTRRVGRAKRKSAPATGDRDRTRASSPTQSPAARRRKGKSDRADRGSGTLEIGRIR